MLHLKGSLLAGVSLSAFTIVTVPALAQQSASHEAETVIVTGTRVQGMTAADSATPITVLGTDALSHGTGSTDLRQQLGQTVPSFTAQQFGGDTANLTLSARLRGLSPNDTLVLVNGKRRHYTGNLQVGAGSSGPDISLIPSAAVDHVEVLLDGAAAQYGTDAVAGVVNIILKNKSSGGQLSATAGDYFDRGSSSLPFGNTGEKYDLSFNMGLPLFDKGFVNVTVSKQYQNFTQYGGADNRYVNAANQAVPQAAVTSVSANGVANLGSTGIAIPNSFIPGVIGYPRANPINANPELQLTMASVNSAYDFSDNFQLYAFGTIGHKFGKSYENDRLPNQIIATMGSNQPCSATNLNGYETVMGPGGPACAPGVANNTYKVGSNTLQNVGTTALIQTANGPAVGGLNPVTGQVVASGNAGNLFSSTLINARTGALLPAATGESALGSTPVLVLYPGGFQPMEVLKEDDYQYNAGMKFNVAGWDVDAAIGYGKDIDQLYTWNTGNRTLFIDTHTTPLNFYDGSFTASQLTGTLDATHTYNVGLASPLTVAVGVEAREDLYGISAGEPLSYYKEGAQSYPGFSPASAGTHSRKNYAGYVDLAVAPIEEIQIDVAGRIEHYTDFGNTEIGKITARYDITPQWAIRGTVSTGFRAPTLAEEFYTNTNVTPNAATIQFPANSAAAALLGLPNLKPESSTSWSVGIVAHPIQDLSVTVDAYSIAIGNRIAGSSTVTASGGAINAPALVNSAIALFGVSLDPTASQQGVTAYLNGMSTLSQGVDMTANYPTDFGDYGMVSWTLAGNYNENTVGRVNPVPAVLLAENPNASFFNFNSQFGFAHSLPDWRIGLTADWNLDQFGATLRNTFYGPSHSYSSPNSNGEYIPENAPSAIITDLEGRYQITDQLELSIGANNILNIRPRVIGPAPSCSALPSGVIIPPGGSCRNGPNTSSGTVQLVSTGNVYQTLNTGPFDPNGGYYYGRITFNF